MDPRTTPLGATPLGDDGARFLLWAPDAERVEVELLEPHGLTRPLEPLEAGYHGATIPEAGPGSLYLYRLDGGPGRPDPASRHQPAGVHGPSRIVAGDEEWSDGAWKGLPLEDHVFYEIHVGTFTEEGTLDAAVRDLDRLRDLGITAVELMPVAQFPGRRNWGYDGVQPWAVHDAYGGPEALARFVDACHARGMAVVLDVVYNHMGPEGCYLHELGPYFTSRYETPWGKALNFDGAWSDEVRRYFLDNALYWIRDLHLDGLRLDAVHAILDTTARTFLEDLAHVVRGEAERSGRRIHLFPESDRNDARLVRRPPAGYGLDAVWSDDFHHSLHALLTGEDSGYYADYGRVAHLARAFDCGFTYTGQHSAFRRRRHGSDPSGLEAGRFVVCAQNHDQVGNRREGDRLSTVISFEGLKLAAATVLLSPFLPLLFMGEEYGEKAPFLYFIEHGDPELVEAVREGRKAEFAAFGWQDAPPDPQAEETFLRCKLDRGRRAQEEGETLEALHRELLRLRREEPALRPGVHASFVEAREAEGVLVVARRCAGGSALHVHHFGSEVGELELRSPLELLGAGAEGTTWRRRLDTSAERWGGPGADTPDELSGRAAMALRLAPHSAVLWTEEGDAA